jgi:MFS family permease
LKPRLLDWWTRADRPAKIALVAASLGWMLDAFDVMLYALVLGSIRKELGLDAATAGFLQSLTLIASAVGGFLFGVLADRWGRTRALMLSVLLYSVFTALCGFASTALQLGVFRVFLGLAARLWSPRPGPMKTAARRSGSCKVLGPSVTHWPRS